MGRPCACCTSSRRAEIDSLLACGTSNKIVAEGMGLTASQISRHKRRCLAPLSEADQVQLWLGRAEELWVLAGANGDLRGQATALQQGLRSLEFCIRRRTEEEQKHEARTLPASLAEWSEEEVSRFRTYLDNVFTDVSMLDSLPPIGGRLVLPLRN